MGWQHLSYKDFKDFFGDLGLTAWVKFNWLAEVPDGYAKVELASLNWIKSGSVVGTYYANGDSLGYKHSATIKAFCSKYEYVGIRRGTTAMTEDPAQCCALYYDSLNPAVSEAYVRDTTIEWSVAAIKQATKNVWLIYEKA